MTQFTTIVHEQKPNREEKFKIKNNLEASIRNLRGYFSKKYQKDRVSWNDNEEFLRSELNNFLTQQNAVTVRFEIPFTTDFKFGGLTARGTNAADP